MSCKGVSDWDNSFPEVGDIREGYLVLDTTKSTVSYDKKLLPQDQLE